MRASALFGSACVCIGLVAAACIGRNELPPGPAVESDAGEDSDAGSSGDAGAAEDAGSAEDAGTGTDGGSSETVLFEDDFEQPGTPDPEKWSLCPRGGSVWDAHMSESYDQAYVADGMLILRAEKVDGIYKAGGVQTRGNFSFTYGKVEVRAKFQSAQGGWPAIWMIAEGAQDWPECGEIDLMEHINHEEVVNSTIHSYYRDTLQHFDEPPSNAVAPYDLSQLNTYSLEWTPEELIFAVNGTVSLVYPNLHLADEATQMQWPFDKPFYLVLDFALGGPGSWPGEIVDAELPARMAVDWVRVTAP